MEHYVVDLGTVSGSKEIMNYVISQHGKIDILINNVGGGELQIVNISSVNAKLLWNALHL